MKLVSPQYTFELSVLGYGQNTGHWRGRNNLQCEIATLWQKQSDRQSTPVQTYELARMLTNLKRLSSRQLSHVSSTLSDQGLSVDIRALPGREYQVQVQLDRSLTPAWHPYPDFPVEMNIVMNQTELNGLIEQLDKQLSAYPER